MSRARGDVWSSGIESFGHCREPYIDNMRLDVRNTVPLPATSEKSHCNTVTEVAYRPNASRMGWNLISVSATSV